MQLPVTDELVLVAGLPPIRAKKARYYEDRRLTARLMPPAVASFLSPDAEDRREAAFARRLDRLSRPIERLTRDVAVSSEAIGLFVRFWLTATPPIPDAAWAAAKATGTERY